VVFLPVKAGGARKAAPARNNIKAIKRAPGKTIIKSRKR